MGDAAYSHDPREPQHDPAIPPVKEFLAVTRRTWLRGVAKWASNAAVLKQVGMAAGGMASGGVVAYRYFEPKLSSAVQKLHATENALAEKDFVIGRDTTDVSLLGEGRYVTVTISRNFTQVAQKAGNYKYQRFCDGAWSKDKCSMSLLTASGSVEPVQVDISSGIGEEGGMLGVIEPHDGKVLSFDKGDSLAINLVSVEKIERVKGGYRLRLNAQFSQSSFTLHAKPGALSPQDVEAFVYAENQGQVLVPILLDTELPLNNCTSGLEYLISWVGRSA